MRIVAEYRIGKPDRLDVRWRHCRKTRQSVLVNLVVSQAVALLTGFVPEQVFGLFRVERNPFVRSASDARQQRLALNLAAEEDSQRTRRFVHRFRMLLDELSELAHDELMNDLRLVVRHG